VQLEKSKDRREEEAGSKSATISDLGDEEGGEIQRPSTSCDQNDLVATGVCRPFHISVETEEERI